MTRTALVASDGSEAVVPLPREMWGISRAKLDALLLDRAREAGAQVWQPARVESVHAAEAVLGVRDLETNAVEQVAFDQLIIADGKGATGIERRRPTKDLGIKAHFVNVRDRTDAVTLFSLPGHYCGVAPIEEGLWNVAMSVPARTVREVGGDLDVLWDAILHSNVGLSRRMRGARRAGDWMASPLPRYRVVPNWPLRVIPIGNAAAALEPIGGEGIGLALRSAELAAEAIAQAAQCDVAVNAGRLEKQFGRLWGMRRLSCRAGGLIASHPPGARSAVAMLRTSTAIGQWALRLSGKPRYQRI